MTIDSIVSDPKPENKPAIPDYVIKTKTWVTENPERMRDVAPDVVEKINSAIDDFEVDIPVVGKIPLGGAIKKYLMEKYPESQFLFQGSGSGVQKGVKDAPGYENVPLVDYQEEREVIPDELFDEAMDYAYERYLKEDSFARICEGLYVNYNIDMSPVELSRRLKALHIAKQYEAEQPDNVQNANLMSLLSKRLREIEQLKTKNTELEKKQAVHEALKEKESPTIPEKVGLIRWMVRKLY